MYVCVCVKGGDLEVIVVIDIIVVGEEGIVKVVLVGRLPAERLRLRVHHMTPPLLPLGSDARQHVHHAGALLVPTKHSALRGLRTTETMSISLAGMSEAKRS